MSEYSRLNLYDVPLLVKIIADVLNHILPNFKIKINIFLIGLVIKLLINILIDLKIIHSKKVIFFIITN